MYVFKTFTQLHNLFYFAVKFVVELEMFLIEYHILEDTVGRREIVSLRDYILTREINLFFAGCLEMPSVGRS